MMLDILNMGIAGVRAAGVAWDSTAAGPDLVFANNNLTVENLVGVHEGVLASRSHDTGKRYFEVEITARQVTASAILFVGVATSNYVVASNWVGRDADSWGFDDSARIWNNNSNSGYGATYRAGDVIGVRMDFGAGVLGFLLNGVDQGNAVTSGLGSPLFPAVSLFNLGEVPKMTGRFRASDFTQAIPSGFTAWDE